jgi:hypothetical protein
MPHVMIDGAARPGTAATLSHWPRSSTPPELRRDLSAQIVIAALEAGYLDMSGVEVATIDHYDEDGVLALALALVPGLAERHADLLVEAAAVGDFGVVQHRKSALIAFTLAALAGPIRTPLESVRALGGQKAKHLEICGLAATHALSVIGDLARDPSPYEKLWVDEASAFDASSAGLGDWVSIEELPEHDLAIVRVASEHADAHLAHWEGQVVHPAAVNSSTERLRVATIAGERFEMRYRYESWVRMASFRPRPRVDLSGLASALTELEPAGAKWHFDGAGATRPVLATLGKVPSGVPPDEFLEQVVTHLFALDSETPAWDPYR